MYIHALVVYIMASTNLTVKDMGQIIDTLPKEGNKRVKTTLENFIDEGIEIGLKKGLEKGKELHTLNLILQTIEDGLEIPYIAKLFKVPIKTVKIIKKCHKDNFKTKSLRKELAIELLSTSQHLENNDIAKFCALNIEEVEVLKEELLSED